jgi:hypothetical protein
MTQAQNTPTITLRVTQLLSLVFGFSMIIFLAIPFFLHFGQEERQTEGFLSYLLVLAFLLPLFANSLGKKIAGLLISKARIQTASLEEQAKQIAGKFLITNVFSSALREAAVVLGFVHAQLTGSTAWALPIGAFALLMHAFSFPTKQKLWEILPPGWEMTK